VFITFLVMCGTVRSKNIHIALDKHVNN
jgi:hypothetical protein